MKRFCDPKLCRSDFIPPIRKRVRSLKSPHIHSHFKDKLVLNLYITSWALWTRLQVTLTRGNYYSLKHHLLSGALITSRKSGLGRKTGKWTDFPILDCHMYFSFSYAACCWCGVLFSFINCPWIGLQASSLTTLISQAKLFLEAECTWDALQYLTVSPGMAPIKQTTYLFVNHYRDKSQSGFK